MQDFVIMTKGREKRLLAADDEKHIKLLEEIGYRMTGKGCDEAAAHDVEVGIQRPVAEREKALEHKIDKIVSVLMD